MFRFAKNFKNSADQIQVLKTTMFVHWHVEFEGSILFTYGDETFGNNGEGFWAWAKVVKAYLGHEAPHCLVIVLMGRDVNAMVKWGGGVSETGVVVVV